MTSGPNEWHGGEFLDFLFLKYSRLDTGEASNLELPIGIHKNYKTPLSIQKKQERGSLTPFR